MLIIIVFAAIGIAGVAAYQLLHRIKEAADERAKTHAGPRARVWALVALLAAIGLFALHSAGHMSPHVGNHVTRSIYSEP